MICYCDELSHCNTLQKNRNMNFTTYSFKKSTLNTDFPSHTTNLVKSLSKLVERRGNFKTLQEHTLLTLEAHILGSANEATNITLGLDVLT